MRTLVVRPLIVLMVCLLCPGLAPAAPPSSDVDTGGEVQRLRAEIDALRAEYDARIATLEAALVRLEARHASAPAAAEDEAAALRAAAVAAAAETSPEAAPAAEPTFVGRQRNLNRLNPEISVTGDLLYIAETDAADAFEPRAVELAFQANLDPFSSFKVIASADDFESIVVEEGYMTWTSLPGNMSLKVGRFFQQVGDLNRWHIHALPQVDRPAAFPVLFGEEGKLSGDGVSLNWLLPGPGDGSLDLTAEIANAANEVSFSGAEFDSLSGLLHLRSTWNVGTASLAEVGLTALGGSNGLGPDSETFIGGLTALLRWSPANRARYRGFDVRTEVFRTIRDDPSGKLRSWQGYFYGEGKLGRSWLAGLRVDRTEDPLVPDDSAWSFNPYVTFWQSEFVRLRAQLQFLRPGGDLEDSERFLLQATFSAGPHKHEQY